MPRKAKFTKEQIIGAAVDIVRREGMEALSARTLAKEMHCSSQPIFSYFGNMEQVQNAVIEEAEKLYSEYVEEGLKEPIPFKGAGLKYIEFAKDEPELFSLLFMSPCEPSRSTHFLPDFDRKNGAKILAAARDTYSLSEEKAKKLHNHLAVYTHGLAVLYARKASIFTIEEINVMLTEVFKALIKEL